MDFFMKLPRNKREFGVFLLIVSVLSVNVIAPLITCFELGFDLNVWKQAREMIPFIWVCVIALVLLTYRPAEILTGLLVEEKDSFRAHITINILCSVLVMSVFLTIIGSWIGAREISMDPIYLFFYKWPRNFAISFFVEALFAQPIARYAMLWIHRFTDREKIKCNEEV